MKPNILWKSGSFRIIEEPDTDYYMKDLKGDLFNPEVNTDILPSILTKEEREFEKRIEDYGVIGVILQWWNPEVDKGWEHKESCWGILGDDEDSIEDIKGEYIAIAEGRDTPAPWQQGDDSYSEPSDVIGNL